MKYIIHEGTHVSWGISMRPYSNWGKMEGWGSEDTWKRKSQMGASWTFGLDFLTSMTSMRPMMKMLGNLRHIADLKDEI